jgi:hypothetical protein
MRTELKNKGAMQSPFMTSYILYEIVRIQPVCIILLQQNYQTDMDSN